MFDKLRLITLTCAIEGLISGKFIMFTHIVLISNRRHPMDDKFYVKCKSKEHAKEMARNYNTNEFYVEIYELGKRVDF